RVRSAGWVRRNDIAMPVLDMTYADEGRLNARRIHIRAAKILRTVRRRRRRLGRDGARIGTLRFPDRKPKAVRRIHVLLAGTVDVADTGRSRHSGIIHPISLRIEIEN